jgi:hypothetical protein
VKRARLAVLAYAFEAAVPPAEIQLWNLGGNATDYGVHYWTERSAREVFAIYRGRGNPLQIDVEHGGAKEPDPSAPPPTGGYARLELRAGEPWLVFDWSAYAVKQITTRQRLFLSPEYDVDKATGEIVRLVRVSLVGDPGTHHARQLARIAAAAAQQGDESMNLALILAALKAALTAEDPETAKAGIQNLIAEIEKAAGASDGADGGAAPGGGTPPPEQAAAAPDVPPGAGEPDGDEAKKKAAAAADPMKCRAPLAVVPVPEVVKRLAVLETENAQRREREEQARIAARGEILPESLRAHAQGLTDEQFSSFCNVPEIKASIAAHAKVGGVRAAAKRTQGDTQGDESGRPEGELDKETQRHMARVFGTEMRPTEQITTRPNGTIRASHLARPSAGGKA